MFKRFQFLIIIILVIVVCVSSILISQDAKIKLVDGVEKDDVYVGYAFADIVKDYNGVENKSFPKEYALNGVRGSGDKAGSLDVFVVGEEKYVVFEWKGKSIINGNGIDFKVFENGFYVTGDKKRMSLDLGTVEVSKDGTNWLAFPVSYDKKEKKNSPIGKKGFVGLTPVYTNIDNNFIKPNLNEAGGDGFDLSDVGIKEGESIKYIKVIDGGSSYPDGQIESNGIDIDGVCAFYWTNE
jgi:hypothetical protein